MRKKSVVSEAAEINLAVELVKLGARLQVLEAETSLSRERLLKLYKEVKGMSPPKGMLPYSTDWFMSWQPNIHSSLFLDVYNYLTSQAGVSGIDAIIKAYRLYLEHVEVNGLERVLSLTRAWSLVRFLDAKMVTTVPCTECSGHFVAHAMDLHKGYVCGLCNVPSRAGKTKKSAARAEPVPLAVVPAVPELDELVPVALLAQAAREPRLLQAA